MIHLSLKHYLFYFNFYHIWGTKSQEPFVSFTKFNCKHKSQKVIKISSVPISNILKYPIITKIYQGHINQFALASIHSLLTYLHCCFRRPSRNRQTRRPSIRLIILVESPVDINDLPHIRILADFMPFSAHYLNIP